ncbi:MAG TPA: ABC transporter permease, partial [Ottowia sp.]|nr:ABC transporter permease [Ottowia sp.]HOZ93439.1 ABC transporter permease [Ottowia sp.]
SRAPRTLLALPVLLATGILGVMLALQISHSPKLLLVLPILLLAGITAASMALVFNAKAKGYDFFTYYFAVLLSPMMFLSGVFFPREQLPPFAHAIANWLPLSAVVDLVRPLFLDQWPANAGRHLAVLAAYAIVGFWVALAFTRQRFRR